MPWRASPDRRSHADKTYHRVLKLLRDNPLREFAPGEVARILEPSLTGEPLRHFQTLVGKALRKFLNQGIAEWNGILRLRRYWIEPKNFVAADERLRLFEAAERGEPELPDNAPAILMQKPQEQSVRNQKQRRW
ncbi:hypothetical protein KJZ99_04170 [bacterium]|nr:hypothetical protein [bacterium]